MNRIIKFRAWYKREKRICEVFSFCKDFVKIVSKDVGDGVLKYPIEYFELMQFTGLLDKNVKEIYEGDIDKSGNVIMWSEKHSLFCLHYYQSFLEKWVEASYPIDASSIEVIGNIYENKTMCRNADNI
jgi:uncharacterized phage protein (TIGR01671 family)